MTTTPTAPELAGDLSSIYGAALPLRESWQLADPALIDQHAALLGWPAVIAKWRALSFDDRFGKKGPAMPTYAGRGIGGDQFVGRATRAAEADLWADTRGRLDDGRIVLLAYQAPRQLGAPPVQVPAALVAGARVISWRSGKVEAGGMEFIECKVIEAADLAAAAPEAVTDPPPTDDRLVSALAALFTEAEAWETLGPAKLAPVVAQRDRRFRPGNGVWSIATLVDKIKILKQAAKAEARARRGVI